MALTRKVTQADGSTLVVDLHGSSTTAIKTIHWCPGDPVYIEAWSGGWDAPGGTLKKSQDRNRSGHIIITIPPQATDAALEALIVSVRDAFYTTGNLLVVQEGSGAIQKFPLFRTRLPSPKKDEAVAWGIGVYKQVTRWEFFPTMSYAAQGDSVYAV